MKFLPLLLLGSLSAMPAMAQLHPYYTAPAAGEVHYMLTNGPKLPDTAVVQTPYAFADIRSYSSHPPEDYGTPASQLTNLQWQIVQQRLNKLALLEELGAPQSRSLNPEGDSLWFYGDKQFYISFAGKGNLATGLRSVNYYRHISLQVDFDREELYYRGPSQAHINLSKIRRKDRYYYELNVQILDKRFRQKDSGKGLELLLAGGGSLRFPEQPVHFDKVNTAVFGDLYYLSANLELNEEQVQQLAAQPLTAIRLAKARTATPSGEAEDVQQYSRLLYKIR